MLLKNKTFLSHQFSHNDGLPKKLAIPTASSVWMFYNIATLKYFWGSIFLFLSIICAAQSNASFEYEILDGCAPTQVQFSNTSTGEIASYSWIIEDSPVSTLANPILDFSFASTYQVCLAITDEDGFTDEYCEFIEIAPPPQAVFEVNTNTSCTIPLQVLFSPNIPAGADYSFEWDFGDGSTSNAVAPIHQYTSEGSFDVKLIVVDNETACTDTLVETDYIKIGIPSAELSFQTLFIGACDNTEVEFSLDNLTNVSSVLWDFGEQGGNSSTQLNPSYEYTTTGCFTPSVILNPESACAVTLTANECIEAEASLPISYTTQGALRTCNPNNPLEVQFYANAPGAVEYNWGFGALGFSNEQNPTFTFDQVGEFPVSFTAFFPNGCIQSVVDTTVVIEPLHVAFEADVTSGCTGLEVNFQNTSTIDYPIQSYFWDFGFTTSTLENPSISYNNIGLFAVSLTITTTNGCEETLLLNDFIKVGIAPSVDFSLSTMETCAAAPVFFTNNSSANANDFLWKFGDGETSTDENPFHFYTDVGYMDVTLVASENGCADSLTIEDAIHILPPIAEFEYEKDCNSTSINFINNSIAADTYLWEFGDGTSSNEENPVHTYATFDTFFVKLTAYNGGNICLDEKRLIIPVTDVEANFELVNDDVLCPSNSIEVINNSVDAIQYEWIFDDNNVQVSYSDSDTSNIRPEFSFPYAGSYTNFGLIASDSDNCRDTIMLADTIVVSDLESDFNYELISPCFPVEIQFNELATSEPGEVISYFWNFDDGTIATTPNPSHVFTESGGYNVILTIKNDAGCSTATTRLIELDANDLNPDFEIIQNDCSSLEFQFTNLTQSADALDYSWDFGNGDTSNEEHPQYTFTQEGNYTVCLIANNANCEAVFCRDLQLFLGDPSFTSDQANIACVSDSLEINFTSIAPGASAWKWDFGTGDISNEEHPSYLYPQAGIYSVCLYTESQFGCRDTFCERAYVKIGGPSGQLMSFSESGCPNLDANFNIETTNTDSYILDFGNGESIAGMGNIVEDSLLYTYTSAGVFTPTLTLTDSLGCSASITSENAVEVIDSGIDFTASNTHFCVNDNLPISFFTIANDLNDINYIEWHFPGSNTPISYAINPNNILYDEPGTYAVSVLVESSTCTQEILKEDFIVIQAQPQATFELPSTTLCSGNNLEFINTSTNTDSTQYTWKINDSAIDSTFDFDHTFAQSGWYELSLESVENGCSNTNTQAIQVFGGIQVELEDEELLCQNQQIQLIPTISNNNEILYQWSPAKGLNCTSCQMPIASPSQSTNYRLMVLTSDGCQAMDSIQVKVSESPLPDLVLSENTTICAGDEIQLQASSNETNTNFQWDSNALGLDCYQNCANPMANPSETTTYSVSIANDEGCVSTDSVTVEVLVFDLPILEDDQQLCEGDALVLNVLNGNNPVWENNPDLSCLDCPNPNAQAQEDTEYIVQITSDDNCIISDTIAIDVIENIEIDAGEDQVICLGDSLLLQANYDAEIIWTQNGNLIGTNETAIAVSPSQDAVYTLNVINENCQYTDQLAVQVFENSEVWADNYEICEGEEIMLSVGGYATDFEWFASPFLNETQTANPIAQPSQTTVFTVVGTAGTCPPDTANVLVEVNFSPEIQQDQFIPIQAGSELVLQPQIIGNGEIAYTWTPDPSLSCWDCPNPIATPTENALYELTVVDENGCSNSLEIQIQVTNICQESSIVVPSAFTPNQDGENDFFYVRGTAEMSLFQVFNRWGEKVFETTNPSQGWDGTYKGQILNRGVFVYYIEANCSSNGETIIKTGDVTLIR